MKKNLAFCFILIVFAMFSVSCNLGGPETGESELDSDQTVYSESDREPAPKSDKLSGVFTVSSDGKQVQFAKGALYWDGSSFKLEENQYDFRTWNNAPSVINGEYKENNTDISEGVTGLFYWSKDVEKTYSENYDSTGSLSDTFALINGRAIEGWTVLRKAEWEYLLNRKDNNDNYKYGLATITTAQGASVHGLVLLPDNWTKPAGCNWTAGTENDWTTNTYNATQWTKMEQAGAVFLPTSGIRTGSSVSGVGDYGNSWSLNLNGTNNAYRLFFRSSSVFVGDYYRSYGQGVRLVMQVEN